MTGRLTAALQLSFLISNQLFLSEIFLTSNRLEAPIGALRTKVNHPSRQAVLAGLLAANAGACSP